MPSGFPASLDVFTNPLASDSMDILSHSGQHADVNDANAAVQAKVGIDGSTDRASVDYKLHSGPINVTWAPYSAVGDGSDATTALQAAVTAASAGAHVVYVPSGIYLISAPVTIPSNVTIRGDGMGLTVFTVSPSLALTSAPFVNANVPVTPVRIDSNIAFERLSVDGSGRSYVLYLTDPGTGAPITNPAVNLTRNPAYNTRGNIFKMNAVDGLRFTEVEIYGHQSLGIADLGGRKVHISRCKFHGNGKVDDIASPVFSQSLGSLRMITAITATNPPTVTTEGGHLFANGDSIQISGVRGMASIPDGNYTVASSSGSTFQLSGIDSSGDVGFTYTGRAYAANSWFIPSEDVTLTDCDFYDNLRSAISFSPSAGGTIANCTFHNNGESTIFSARSRNVTIANNRFIGNNLTDIAAALIEFGTATDVSIIGNYFEQSAAEALSIQAVVGGVITGNRFRNIIKSTSVTYPYAPLAEDWTGSTQGPGNIAGTAFTKFGYMRLTSLSARKCSDIVVANNVFIDDRDTPLTTNGVIFSKSGTNNIVSDIQVINNDFTRSGVAAANMVTATDSTTALEYTLTIAANMGHASENPVLLTGTLLTGATGVVNLTFGFPPRLVIIRAFQASNTNVRASEMCIARDRTHITHGTLGYGYAIAIDGVQGATRSADTQATTTDGWRVQDGSGTVQHKTEFQSWLYNGIALNVITANIDVQYVIVGHP